jgi:hypothetical protein
MIPLVLATQPPATALATQSLAPTPRISRPALFASLGNETAHDWEAPTCVPAHSRPRSSRQRRTGSRQAAGIVPQPFAPLDCADTGERWSPCAATTISPLGRIGTAAVPAG